MVKALLEGRKFQTRRLLGFDVSSDCVEFRANERGEWRQWFEHEGNLLPKAWSHRCPFGKPGDRLWVREAWRTGYVLDQISGKDIEKKCREAGFKSGPCCPIYYEADGGYRAWGDNDGDDFGEKGRLRPSIFMPRWASRLTLELTDVRVERLQEISEGDAKAEGVEPWSFCAEQPMTTGEMGAASPYRGGFACLWDDINDKIATWKSNPFVWVLSFKVAERRS